MYDENKHAIKTSMKSLCNENGILNIENHQKEKVLDFLKYSFDGVKTIEEAQKKILNVVLQCRKVARKLNCNVKSWSHEMFSIQNLKDFTILRMKSEERNC